MTGTKALYLEEYCRRRGRAYVRFDYFGHGASSGDFASGTIGRWRDDAVAVIDSLTEGKQILVGSSMSGWIMLLAALARPERIAGAGRHRRRARFHRGAAVDPAHPGAAARDRRAGPRRAALRLRPGRLSVHAGADRGRQKASAARTADPDRRAGAAAARDARRIRAVAGSACALPNVSQAAMSRSRWSRTATTASRRRPTSRCSRRPSMP